LQKTAKFRSPSMDARKIVMAVDGAVVSNPMAMNTTRRSGFSRAIFRESRGEYTIRMSAPLALESKKDPRPPGTRIMSPNEVMMVPACSAMKIASSTRPMGITHTGQPGPWTSCTLSGR
jgi:hypothetical protein